MTTPFETDPAVKWADPLTITYSLATANLPNQPGNLQFTAFMNPTHEGDIRQAAAMWEANAGVRFVEVPDSAASDIRFGFGHVAPFAGLTEFSYDPSQHTLLPGVIVQIDDTLMAANDTIVLQDLEHELGHALGLGHSDMSDSLMFPTISPSNRNLGADDIAAIRTLYGDPLPVTMTATFADTTLSEDDFSAIGANDWFHQFTSPATGRWEHHSLPFLALPSPT